MTPTEFITAARRKYNSVGSTFYSDDEILDLLYQAEMELSTYALTIETTDSSTTTVAGTREYTIPTRALAIKRVTYDGQKLKKISFREDDELTVFDEDETGQGTPLYYEIWDDSILLRPLPDDTKTLKYYYYGEPAIITVTDTIETPTRFHMDMVDSVVGELMYKDENATMGDRYRRRFEGHLVNAKKWQQRRKRTDGFHSVMAEEGMINTVIGAV